MNFQIIPFLLISFVIFDLSSSDSDIDYTRCNLRFKCGTKNFGYPFWGGDRPTFCGHPKLELACVNDNTSLEINKVSYRVLEIGQDDNQILKLAREDYLNGICPTHFANTTLDPDLFQLESEYDNFPLFYGCSTARTNEKQLIQCSAADGCETSVIVPLLKGTRIQDLASVEKGLKDGFVVSNKVDNTACEECQSSYGFCAYDDSLNKPICYCLDQRLLSPRATCIHSTIPTGSPLSSNPRSDSGKQLKLGLAIRFSLFVGVFLGSILAVYLLKRRKKTLGDENKTQLTPSSNGFTNSSANLIRSIPSYPSSNFDLEKGSSYFGAQIFQFTELVEATENFNPSKELGDGGFGTVYYGKLKDGRVVAVKRLYENNFKRAEQFMNEIEILSRLRHPNLVTLYGCTSRQSRELLLVYEYVPNGTIADHIHENQQKSGLITWPIRLRIAVETATALTYLHASDVIHRDVKSNNILLDHNFSVKVADFGMSRLFPTNVTHVSTAPQGTPGYVDPEYYQCYQLTDKSDVYSFGVVLVELISSKEAVDTSRSRHDINLSNMAVSRIQNHALHELVDPRLGFKNDYDTWRKITSVAELAFRCLQQETDLRPSMSEVLEALKEIENEELGTTKAEVMDIVADEVVLLKSLTPPHYPDSASDDKKWVSTPTPI